MSIKNFKSQSGATLMESVLAVGLLGFIIYTMITVSKKASESQQYTKLYSEIDEVRSNVRRSFDCARSLKGQLAQCAASDYIEGRMSDGTPLFPAFPDVQPYGGANTSLQVRATCSPVPGSPSLMQIGFQYRGVMPDSSLKKNPLTGKTMDWTTLLPVPFQCPLPNNVFGPCVWAEEAMCPANYAASAMVDPGGPAAPPTAQAPIHCCPVPTDLLTADTVTDPQTCGPDRVMTGTSVTAGNRNLHCTKINTSKYKLGAETKGTWYRLPSCVCTTGGIGATWALWTDLPIPLRHQFMKRENLASSPWFPGPIAQGDTLGMAHESMCVPIIGGLMTRRSSKQCGDMYGKQVQFLDGTPVQMYPTGCTIQSSSTAVVSGNQTVSGENISCTSVPLFWKDAMDAMGITY